MSKQNIEPDIQRMVEYIEQDGLEKAEEIEIKAEEEFIVEKNKYRDKEIFHISRNYEKLEKNVERNGKAEVCRFTHRSRLRYLESLDLIMQEINNEASERLRNVDKDDNKDSYKKILAALIVQGLAKMLEEEVLVRVREKDVNLMKDIFTKSTDAYKSLTQNDVRLSLDEGRLPEDCMGGVILISTNQRISIENTLESRLHIITYNSPQSSEFRNMLFGANPNRKHMD